MRDSGGVRYNVQNSMYIGEAESQRVRGGSGAGRGARVRDLLPPPAWVCRCVRATGAMRAVCASRARVCLGAPGCAWCARNARAIALFPKPDRN